jgi:hypothetical protein
MFTGSTDKFSHISVTFMVALVVFPSSREVSLTWRLIILAGHGFIRIGISIVLIHGMSIMRVSSPALKLGYR